MANTTKSLASAARMTKTMLKMQDQDNESFGAAVLACLMIQETGKNSTIAATEMDQYIQLADRIMNGLMMVTDEPRFSALDYVDGVVHATCGVDMKKLLKLDDSQFEEAMIWLAADKRATYECAEHPEPLDIDIWY